MKKLIIVVFLFFTTYANALATGATMSFVLNEIEDKAKSIIAEFENSSNNFINNGVFTLLHTVDQLKEDYADVLHKTSNELTRHEKQIFEGIETQSNNLFKSIKEEHDRIDDSLDNLAIYLSDTIFVGDEPRISRFLSNTFVHGNNTIDKFKVVIKGKNLNHEDNHIIMSQKKITPIVKADNQLVFEFDRRLIDSLTFDNKLVHLPIKLYVHEDTFLWFTKDKEYKYIINVIPNDIATIAVKYIQDRTRKINQHRVTKHGSSGSFKSGRTSRRHRHVVSNYYPDNGYLVDTNQPIHVNYNGSDHCSGGSSRCGASSTKNAVKADCNLATERGRGGRVTCSYRIDSNFSQYKLEHYTSTETKQATLKSNRDLLFEPTEGYEFNSVILEYFDGTQKVHTTDYSNNLYSIKKDIQNHNVIIKSNVNPQLLF